MKVLFLVILALAHGCLGAISRDEFNRAIQSAGYQIPTDNVYPHLNQATSDFSRRELVMFLAQLIHESGGFRYKEEIICSGPNGCPDSYRDNVGLPGRSYHGRGYIQLTWGANYKACSEGLGMGDLLLRQPELVAHDTRLAVLVSVWYWRSRVRPQMRGQEHLFGASTRAINGAIECSHGWNQRAANRYQIYLRVADALNLHDRASEGGCY